MPQYESTPRSAGVLACGYSLPDAIRHNSDPVFNHLALTRNAHGALAAGAFDGLEQRRRLTADERLEELMADACRATLAQSTVQPGMIDRLYGYGSVPQYWTPNVLYAVHRLLDLPPRTLVVPVNSDFSNFLTSLAIAAEAVDAGACRYALVVCGSNWTRHMDYTQDHSFSIGDGAGAALVGPQAPWQVLDLEAETHSEHFHDLTMSMRTATILGRAHLPVDPDTGLPIPTYHMTDTGKAMLSTTIRDTVPELVGRLLARHRVEAGTISLITHQGSKTLMDHWNEIIKPRRQLSTLDTFGNMVIASYPVNLARYFTEIDTEHIVLVSVGPGLHFAALLLQRDGTA